MVTEIRAETLALANGKAGRAVFDALPNLETGFCPSRIVSLYHLMKPFLVGAVMGLVTELVEISNKGQIVGDSQKEYCRGLFTKLIKAFTFYEMACSAETAKKLLALVDNPHGSAPYDLNRLALELRGRVIDEATAREFFSLTPSEAEHYKNPPKKWKPVIKRFPSALREVEEAWKCFAFARYTAAVFHSLQIVEVGLIELGNFIGVTDPLSGWTSVAQRLKKIIDTKYQDRSEFEKRNGTFLEQTQGTVEALKNAWRNKISHAHGKLTIMTGEEFHPDVAEEILLATRAFMRRLAEGLPPLAEEE
jgi:hypothetical protein